LPGLPQLQQRNTNVDADGRFDSWRRAKWVEHIQRLARRETRLAISVGAEPKSRQFDDNAAARIPDEARSGS
jgi:hypothetical protein